MSLAIDLVRCTAVGCMRLSTEPDRDESRARAVLHAAFDAGVTLLDTADSYCWDDSERGHNERLIADALATWPGDRSCFVIATKGGLTRPGGRWEPDGRARHLTAACEASLRALNLARIDLYQLHVVDPRTSLTTSVRALASLQRSGLVEAIGLCNVTVGQIEEARRITEIASIQIELSLWHDAHLLSGVVDYCITNRIPILAYRPFGGLKSRRRVQSDHALVAIAERHDVTPFAIARAWLKDLSELIVPLPGVTRIETAQAAARPVVTLTDEDRELLDARSPEGRAIRLRSASGIAPTPTRTDGEVVLIMGLPGAGKSTVAASMVGEGYVRLNRDEAGGSLRELAADLERTLANGTARVVLDNTYASRKSRAEVIRVATAHRLPVRCVWLTTSIEEAQTNAVTRIVCRYGKLLVDEELERARKHDVAAFLPTAQFRYQREFEPPEAAERFSRIDRATFQRQPNPLHVNRALIVWCDGTILRSKSGARVPVMPEDVVVPERCGEVMRQYQQEGWKLLGMSWQPEISSGAQSRAGANAVFARMNALLGVPIEIEYCPHPAGPPTCWCRKPLPGLGVVFRERHSLNPAHCIYVGSGAQDAAFARRLGFQYADAAILFS